MSESQQEVPGRPEPVLRRRTIVAAGAALFAAGGVLGWALRGPGAQRSETGDAKVGRPLTILSGRDETHGSQREHLITTWNGLGSTRPAEVVSLPSNADLQYSAIRARLQAGDDSVDIVNLDVPWIAEFASQGHLVPLDDFNEQGFLPEPLEAGRFDETLYAVPFNTDVGLLYYNVDVIPEPPTTWAGIETVAQALSGDFEAAIAMQLAPYEGFTVNFLEYLRANAIDSDEHGLVDFRQRDAARRLEQFRRDINLGDVIHRDSQKFQEGQSYQAFLDGKVPMLRHWPTAYRELRVCDATEFQIGVAPMPGRVLGGQSLAVSAHSPYREEARALVEYLTNTDSQKTLFRDGGFAATRLDPYVDSQALIERDGEPGCVEADSTNAYPRPEAEMLLMSLEGAGTRPVVERYRQWSSVLQQAAPDPSVSAEELQERLDDALDGRAAHR